MKEQIKDKILRQLADINYRNSVSSNIPQIPFSDLLFTGFLNRFNDMKETSNKIEHMRNTHFYIISQAFFKVQRKNGLRNIRDHFISKSDLEAILKISGVKENNKLNNYIDNFLKSDLIETSYEFNGVQFYKLIPLSSFGGMSFEYTTKDEFSFKTFRDETIVCVASKPLKTATNEKQLVTGVYSEQAIANLLGISQSHVHIVLAKFKKAMSYCKLTEDQVSIVRKKQAYKLDNKNDMYLGSKIIYDANYKILMKSGVRKPIKYLSKTNKNHLTIVTPDDFIDSVVKVPGSDLCVLTGLQFAVDETFDIHQEIAHSRDEAAERLRIRRLIVKQFLEQKLFIETNSNHRFSDDYLRKTPLNIVQQHCGMLVSEIYEKLNIKSKKRAKKVPGVIAHWKCLANSLLGNNNINQPVNLSLSQILLSA